MEKIDAWKSISGAIFTTQSECVLDEARHNLALIVGNSAAACVIIERWKDIKAIMETVK